MRIKAKEYPFQVFLSGSPKPKPDYKVAYGRAFLQAVRAYADDQQDKDRLRRLIFYGVKALGRSTRSESDYDGLVLSYQTIGFIKDLIGQLTPAELMQLFPVEKKYDGAIYQMKDYYSTMDAIQQHGLNTPIGKDASKMLWDYMNPDIFNFMIELLCVMSAIQRAEGKKGLLEEFFEQQGKPLTVYHEITDSKGRTFITDSKTGKITLVHKKRPRYLRALAD